MADPGNGVSEPVEPSPSLNLSAINAALVQASSSSPDAQSREERDGYTRAMEEARLQSFTQDTAERKKYAPWIFWLVAGWISAIFIILLLAGFRPCGFLLSEKVLLVAIGSTTVNILGVLFIVVRYLFSRDAR